MRGGIVHGKQRTEVRHRPLRHIAAHLLRLVQNQNRIELADDVDRPPGAKALLLRIDDTGRLVAAASVFVLAFIQRCRERLRVDDHDADFRIPREFVQKPQVTAVVDEEVRHFVVIFTEMLHRVLEGAFDAFADGDARHDDDIFRPAKPFVQFEDGLDIDVGLAGPRLHLDVQRAAAQRLRKRVRLLQLVLVLNVMDVVQQHLVG